MSGPPGRKRSAKEAQLAALIGDARAAKRPIPAPAAAAEDDVGELLGSGGGGMPTAAAAARAPGLLLPLLQQQQQQLAQQPAALQLPPVASRLLGALFAGVPSAVLAARLSRPLPLDAFRAPAPTAEALLARARAKRERALHRATARAARAAAGAGAAAAASAAAAAAARAAAPPPPAGSLLGLALALAAPRAPPPPPPQPAAAAAPAPAPALPQHRRLHGWATEASVAAAAAAHWRSALYALTCRAAAEAAGRRVSGAAGGAGGGGAGGGGAGGGGAGGSATLADINRAELEARRARKGWLDPSLSAREHKRSGQGGGGGGGGGSGSGSGAGATAAPSAQLPSSLPLGASELEQLVRAKGWALVQQGRWVGAQVAGVEGRGGGGAVGGGGGGGGALCGTVAWVGRCFFTLRRREGSFVTLRKAGCQLRVQWPAKAGASGSVALSVPAAAMAEAKAWER